MKTIKLLGDDWKIQETKRLPRGTYGEALIYDHIIRIRSGLTPKQYAETLGHEIIHVWLSNMGVAGFLSPQQEESLCDGLGRCLMRFVQENAELFDKRRK